MKFGRYDLACCISFIAYAACSLAIPMCLVEVANTLNFPLSTGGKSAGGALQLGRSIPMVLAMFSCVFLAGKFGKRIVIATSVMLMGLGIMLASISPLYMLLFAALAVAGLGEGLIEGLATPVVQEIHSNEDAGRYLNFSHSFWSIGTLVTTLGVGLALWYKVNWRIIVFICGFLSILPAILFFLPDTKKKFANETKVNFSQVANFWIEILKTPRFWIFFGIMFFAGGGEFALTFWTASFIRLECGGSAFLAGAATAIFAVGMIIGRMGSSFVVSQKKLYNLILSAAALGITFGVILYFTTNIYLILSFLLIMGIAAGPFWPSVQSYCCEERITIFDSTTLYVMLSCAGIPGCGFFSWLLGATGDMLNLRTSLLLVPICFTFVAILTFLERKLPPINKK
jgi:fucose permease